MSDQYIDRTQLDDLVFEAPEPADAGTDLPTADFDGQVR